ncbi:MAG TPA: xanthine dehydrogenase family protein molybdopterin-binding subunit [Chloroflexota bacterium]|nr:xanthine dehydrogenase family protein molybdopterin-binding subunit [Chloroflexota bacterium]
MLAVIGRSLLRREDRALLLGQGQFAGDLQLPGLLHMAVARSVYPHARVDGVHLDGARAMAGVLGAFAAMDLPEMENRLNDPVPAGMRGFPRPVLATGTVRYVGEPIAVVVAEDERVAADAAEAVEVEYTPLAGAGDVLTATEAGAPVLHAELGSNVAGHYKTGFGDITSAFAAGATVVRQTFRLNRVIGGYMEPRASAAVLDVDSGQLTVWTSTQWVHGVRDRIAMLLDLPPEQVRVRASDVGGGFGAKGQVYPEEILVAALARRLGRPVRWVATRTEDTQATAHSHGDSATAELAANADGTLRGLRVQLLHDVGAYAAPGLGQSDNILSHVVSAYRLPALEAESTLVYTNAVPTGFIRGGGREVGNFIVERMMDGLARQLGLDPAELRRRNLIGPERMPYTTGYLRMGTRPVVYDGGDYPRLLDTALDAVGYQAGRRRQAAGERIGIGVACCVESAGIQQPEPATIRIQPNGDVHAYLGSTPGGQGHRTVFAQVVAQHLSWPVERVQVFVGDTSNVSNSANTAGSRSALEVGNAAAAAAREARRRLLDRAQTALEVAADDVRVGPSGAEVRGVPGRQVGLAELLEPDGPLTAHAMFQSSGAYTGAVHAVTVSVDPETATLRILRYVIAHDCGQPINPLLVNGQLQGGLVHGLGYALMEAAVYQPDGTFITPNFLDYTLPGRGLPAAVQPALVEVRSPVLGNNPEGFKGVGETGTIAAPAAIVAAIEDALRTLGVDATLSTLPVTPTRLFDALTGGT